ncbi:hypothetical protein P3572_22820 [Vibrio parahaemolyticus]|nr:hypothetical protein [Vibrio parahaemolyticus]MDG2814875.1 hypothetical protein [Vibrio parahaemolyticus]
MQIREVRASDAQSVLDLMYQLDRESKFMMLEEGERTTTLEQQVKMRFMALLLELGIQLSEIDTQCIVSWVSNNQLQGMDMVNNYWSTSKLGQQGKSLQDLS